MKVLYLLIMFLLLAGCAAGGGVSTGGQDVLIPTITSLAVEVRTLVPASTATSAFPTMQVITVPVPIAQETSTPTAAAPAAAAPPSQGFTECSLTPGWIGCDPSAPRVAGRLAFVDVVGARVIVLDLETGESWQVASHPGRLAWSPDGERLLLAHPTDGGTTYELFRADGVPVEPPATDEELQWQPDGTLDSIMAVHSADGDVARLEYSPDTRWMLRVQPQGGPEQVLDVEPQPTDRLYDPVAWVPGQDQIIVQRYYAGNAAMLSGVELITIDTATGEQQPLEPTAPMGESAAFVWQSGGDPSLLPATTLALTATLGGGGRPSTTLALIDFRSGQARYPLPEGVRVRNPVWMPDGAHLIFAADPLQPGGDFPGPGMYRLEPQGGRVERLTEPTTNLLDDWPNVSSDGQVMVFARAGSLPTGELRVDIMGKRLSDGFEWVIVRTITIPGSGGMALPWERYMAFGHK